MKYLALVCATLALMLPVSALANNPVIFDLVVHTPTYDGSQTVILKKRFFTEKFDDINVSMVSAIQLDADVPADIAAKIVDDSRSPMSAGKTLLSSGGSQTTYCGQVRHIHLGIMTGGPCLIDSDGDGRFDQAALGKTIEFQPNALMKEGENTVAGVLLGRRIALPTPVPYHRVDSSVIPLLKGQIVWKSDYQGKQHQGPVHIAFAYEAMPGENASRLYSGAKEVTFLGRPIDVNLYGVTITIISIAENGDLTVRLSGTADSQPIKFAYTDLQLIFIYY